MTKTCTRCNADLPVDDFYRHPRGRLGRTSWCRACLKAHARERNLRDPEPHREAARRWAARNRQRLREREAARRQQERIIAERRAGAAERAELARRAGRPDHA